MCLYTIVPGYIDPNTSQHVFSLLGPALAFLAAAGGLAFAAIVFIRHRIVSFFKKASWAKRVATVFLVVGLLTIVAAVVWRIIW
jgi:hypothetical protein